jgi:hypothetical protein
MASFRLTWRHREFRHCFCWLRLLLLQFILIRPLPLSADAHSRSFGAFFRIHRAHTSGLVPATLQQVIDAHHQPRRPQRLQHQLPSITPRLSHSQRTKNLHLIPSGQHLQDI